MEMDSKLTYCVVVSALIIIVYSLNAILRKREHVVIEVRTGRECKATGFESLPEGRHKCFVEVPHRVGSAWYTGYLEVSAGNEVVAVPAPHDEKEAER